MRAGPRLLAAAVAVAAVLAAPRAFAWGFAEHTELGSKGYKTACDQLAADLSLDVQPRAPEPGGPVGSADACLSPKNDTTARWCLACRTFPPALYGQSIAIAGDHVGSPDHLMSPRGQVVAASVVSYASLALENVQHFHPAAPRNWRTFHDKALELATKDYPGGPILRSSLEAATVIVRLQAGPTYDLRSGRFGAAVAVGLQFAGTRWITGGGSMGSF